MSIDHGIVGIVSLLLGLLVSTGCALRSHTYRGQRRSADLPRCERRLKALILTASVGGGHEAIGRAVQADLEAAGHRTAVVDGLRMLSPALNWLMLRAYERMLKQVRWSRRSFGTLSWSLTCRFTAMHPVAAVIRTSVGILFARRLLDIIERERPDVVVSTHPMVTAALGHLRRFGMLPARFVAVIPDYGVHTLWVAPAMDLHIAVSGVSARLARQAGGAALVARLPVSPHFRRTRTSRQARAALGISTDAFVALVVGGAWGIGDVEGAAECASGAGAYTVVVAGRNEGLRSRLEGKFRALDDVRVLGWTEDMPDLMVAADCLIQNAGGMTCVEAIETGLPVLMYNPIPGHGEMNVRAMEEAGAAKWVRSREELGFLLGAIVRRETCLDAPRVAPNSPSVTQAIERLVGTMESPRPSRARHVKQVLPTALAVALLLWISLASS